MGIDMLQGGGKMFVASRGRHIGPGHFGLLDLGDGVQKFSMHYEADLDRGGVSVLDIRPLLWRDGWPVAGDNLMAGTYQIESARTGTVLELAVQGSPVGGFRGRRDGAAPAVEAGAPPAQQSPGARPIAAQEPRRFRRMARDHRRARRRHAAGAAEMDHRACRDAGGYPGSPISGSRSRARSAR